MPKNFALIGAAGYIAPRHLKAIHDTNNTLLAALDLHDSVGILDHYFPAAHFFREPERFHRFLEKPRFDATLPNIDYVTVCSPNYLHDAHIRMSLRAGADVICEKPLVINPWNLDVLQRYEEETQRTVYTVLQLRLHESIAQLKRQLLAKPLNERAEVDLTYISRRGRWYHTSWKGDENKSGGVIMNIGIHFFDMLMWLFGSVQESQVFTHNKHHAAGLLELENARVRWFLSVNQNDLPPSVIEAGGYAHRSITINGDELVFTHGFTDLHTKVYERVLAGDGFRIEDARDSINLVYQIRTAELRQANPTEQHPYLAKR